MKEIKIVYDFDGTLTDHVFPSYPVMKKLGISIVDMIKNAKEFIKDKDQLVERFMQVYIDLFHKKGLAPSYENICLGAETISFAEGVEEFFEAINKVAMFHQVKLEHYIITSGMQEFLEKTKIAKYFTAIKGSSFLYNSSNEIIGVKEVVEAKDKVKKLLEINENSSNCTNIIYIGDGFTDFYSMNFVKENHGISICVYDENTRNDYLKLLEKNAIDEGFERDYRVESDLYQFLKESIKKVGE